MMELSVIVPSYNAADCLGQCLDSLVNQTLESKEIIIVNDGSTDASEQIAQKYLRNFKNVFLYTQVNKGLSAARNTGLSHARGEYISFVDSDDWLDPYALQEMYQRGSATRSDIVICDARIFDQNFRTYTPFYDNDIWRELIKRYTEDAFKPRRDTMAFLLEPASWKRIYRRQFLKRYKFSFPEGLIFEDMPAHFRLLLMAERISLVDKPLYYYRVGRSQKITAQKDRTLFQIFEILADIRSALIALNVNNDMWAKYLHFQNRVLKWICWQIEPRLKFEFAGEAAKSIREVPLSGIREFEKQFSDDLGALYSVFCQRYGIRNWYVALSHGDVPRSLAVYLLLKQGNYETVIEALSKRLPPRIVEARTRGKAIAPSINNFRDQLKAFDWRLAVSEIRGKNRVANRVKLEGWVFLFSDQLYRKGLDDAVWRVRENFYSHAEYIPKHGDVLVDVGAHVGVFSIYMAKKYPHLKVIAIEADEQNFANLLYNIEVNSVTNVLAKRLLVGDRSCSTRRIFISCHDSGHVDLRLDNLRESEVRSAVVATKSLQEVLSTLQVAEIALLKISALGQLEGVKRGLGESIKVRNLVAEELRKYNSRELQMLLEKGTTTHFVRWTS